MAKLNEELIRQIGELRTQGKTVRDTARELGLSIGVVSKYGPEKRNSAEQPRLFQLASQVPDVKDIVEPPTTVRREKLEPERRHVRAELVSPDDRQREKQKPIDLEGMKDELRLQLEQILAKFISDCDAKNTELIDLRRQVNELREQKHEHEANLFHEQFAVELKRLEEQHAKLLDYLGQQAVQPGPIPKEIQVVAAEELTRVKAIHVSVTGIRCSGCGQVVSVDKADPVIQRSRRGKCPVCGAVMDLSGLFPGAPPQPLGPPRIFE
jgi:predicted  nucleic acid-binding Zn-ribbon protein